MAKEDEDMLTEEWTQFIRNRCEGDVDLIMERVKNDKRLLQSFHDLVAMGIPTCYRKKVWLMFLDASSLEEFRRGYFKVLKEKEEAPIKNYMTEIKLDLDRTFPTHILAEDTQFKDAIQNILFVYSLKNPSVGYCQSLNYISYLLLLIIDNEEQSFWCLNSIAEKILPEYFTHTMLGAQIDQQVFHDLLCLMFPELITHFKSIGVVIQILTIEWFLCLFSTILPAQKQVKDSEELKDIKYLMKITSFDLTKLKSLKEEFDVLSHDGTGIGYLQFHQLILRFLPDWKELESSSGRELMKLLEKMFEAMDEDNDRLLNFKELVKENKNYLTRNEVKSMIDHVHAIFYNQQLATMPPEVTDELQKKTQIFLESLGDQTTLEGLKRVAQEYPLILESFQTPDHISSSTVYTSGSEIPGLKHRSNSFHLLDAERLSSIPPSPAKPKQNPRSNLSSTPSKQQQQQQPKPKPTPTKSNDNNGNSSPETEIKQFIRKLTPDPLAKRIQKKAAAAAVPPPSTPTSTTTTTTTITSPSKALSTSVDLQTALNEKPCNLM
eukprot:gene20199-24220_t